MLLLIVSWRDCKIWGDANLVTGGQVDTMADAGLDVGGGRDYYNTPGASSWSGHQRCHRQCHQHHLHIHHHQVQTSQSPTSKWQTDNIPDLMCLPSIGFMFYDLYINLLRDGWVLIIMNFLLIEFISRKMRIQILREYCSDIRAAVFFTRWKTSSANFFAQSKTADDNLIMSNDNW